MEIEAKTSSVDLSINDLAAQITELAGHLNAANHRWLMLIAEFDRRNGWSDMGAQSCAHWLNWARAVPSTRALNVPSFRSSARTRTYGQADAPWMVSSADASFCCSC